MISDRCSQGFQLCAWPSASRSIFNMLYNCTTSQKPVIAGKGQQRKWNMNEWDGNSFCNSVFFHTVTPEVDYLWLPAMSVEWCTSTDLNYLNRATAIDGGKWRWCRALCSGIAEVQSATEAQKPELHDIIDKLRCQGRVIAISIALNDMIRIKWYDMHQMILYPII